MALTRRVPRSTQELANDFNQLVDEGRALLSEMLDQPQEKSSNLRGLFDDVSERLSVMQSSATEAARQGVSEGARYARQADKYIRDNPWPFVAGGIIVGVLATLWWSERRY